MNDSIAVGIYVEEEGTPPAEATYGSAGVDVCSKETLSIDPGQAVMVHTGIYMELPPGTECQVRPRSGLALKKGLTVLNSPGTIDSDYRGECNVILINHSNKVQVVDKGDRVAQFVFSHYLIPKFSHVQSKDQLSQTDRGSGGFGSTGK